MLNRSYVIQNWKMYHTTYVIWNTKFKNKIENMLYLIYDLKPYHIKYKICHVYYKRRNNMIQNTYCKIHNANK